MWMLESWFAELNPVSIINEGKTEIEGVRLFSQAEKVESRYVYVGAVKDFFAESSSDMVMMMHGNEMIQIGSDDKEWVINQIITAFEKYSRDEYELLRFAAGLGAEQNIADKCAQMLGPTFIMTPALEIRAFSKNMPDPYVNEYWDELEGSGQFTPESIKAAFHEDFFLHFNMKNKNYEWYSEGAAPYSYGIMNSYYDRNGQLAGQCVTAFKQPPSQAQIQCTEMIVSALNSMYRYPDKYEGVYFSEHILGQGIGRGWITQTEAERLKVLHGWPEGAYFCAVSILSEEKETTASAAESFMMYIKEKIMKNFPGSVCIAADDALCACIYMGSTYPVIAFPRIKDKFSQVFKNFKLRIGISLEFQDICTFPLHHRQANEAAAYCADCAQTKEDDIILCDFRKAGAASLTGSFDKEYAYASLHPAVPGLAQYDKDHKTQYLLTLKAFLRNERSFTRTADELFIHKNTVLYRISKTEEMYYIDLSDPDEREYLAASLRLHEMQRRKGDSK